MPRKKAQHLRKSATGPVTVTGSIPQRAPVAAPPPLPKPKTKRKATKRSKASTGTGLAGG